MNILITSSPDFNDYDFFIWGMFVVFEELKNNTDEFVLYPRGNTYLSALEFSNKIGDSMRTRGFKVITKQFEPAMLYDKDYWVHFMLRGERAPLKVDKTFTL